MDDIGRAEPARQAELSWVRSIATMRDAPARRAPWTALSPTPPHPKTATREPGRTRAVLRTAPTPVAPHS
jgi:hypothetical protein